MRDATATLSDLIAAVAAFRDERDWKQFHTPKNLATAVVTEAAELAELYVWEDGSATPSRDRIARTAQEMADVLIYLLSLADALKVDLAAAVNSKLIDNAAKYPAASVRGSAKRYDDYKL